jgi:hypothetical protein
MLDRRTVAGTLRVPSAVDIDIAQREMVRRR